MSLTKLHLFTKDTDATATEQGFYFQKLVTLRSWLVNRLEQNDVQIYCDYEEDVFERSEVEGKSTFRQVKLYSNNFSFSKEEIIKCVSHFFMLYCKGDYALDNVTFIFETNSGVARQYKAEDPKLLREWWENQDALSDELLERCRKKVKTIIDQYITEVLAGKLSVEMNRSLQDAKAIYDKLSDEVWNGFVKSIRWKFDVIPHDEAIPQLISEIEELVVKLPLSLEPGRVSSYTAILIAEIAARTAEKKPENKVLTKELLDILLLNMGSEEDRWYVRIFEKWKSIDEITHFNFGEFYEVVAAATHCRWKLTASDHDQLWLKLMGQYIELKDTLIVCRRTAIYEYIFLLLSPDPETFAPKNSIDQTQEILRYYFDNIEHRNSFSDLEKDITLLEIASTQSLLDPDFLNAEEIIQWKKSLYEVIENKIHSYQNKDELCLAYQLMGHYELHNDPAEPLRNKILKALEFYNKISSELSDTRSYSIAALYGQSSKILDLMITHDIDLEAIEALEEFLATIENYATDTGKSRDLALGLVKRSVSYISRPSVRNYLAALTNLHKAKDYCNNDDSRLELIVVLLNISKVYMGLGMNMASKYYGLSAVYAAQHLGKYRAFKFISDGCAAVFDADFQQGAWISALDDFHNYMIARTEFSADPLDLEEDKVFREVLLDLSLILIAVEKIHPEMQAYIQYQRHKLGWLYTYFIEDINKGFTTIIPDDKKLKNVLQAKLSMEPLSDIGSQRIITFKSLGVSWTIAVENNLVDTAIAEEFAALLQIILCEIGLLGADLHLIEMPVKINLSQTDKYTQNLAQHKTHDETIWDAAVPVLSVTDAALIPMHYAFLTTIIRTILSNISILPSKEFYETFDSLYVKQKLGTKGLSLNAYQRVYFNFVTEDDFNQSQRWAFNPAAIKDFEPAVPGLYVNFEGLSAKYDQAQVLEGIANRYKNTYKKFSVSLEIWKQDPQFTALIKKLRSDGWLDWQIMLALMNFVVSTKVSMIIEKKPPGSKAEGLAAAEQLGKEMYTQEESENYIPIPASWLVSDRFDLFMNEVPVRILDYLGMENGMKHPNFKQLRKYLSKRFAFAIDDIPELSPLAALQ